MKGRFILFAIAMSLSWSACAGEAAFSAMEYTAGADDVRSLIIDVRDRSIDVVPSDDGQVHIDYSISSKEGYDIRIEDGCLSVHGTSDKSWMGFMGGMSSAESRKIVLRRPEIVLDAVSIATTNENITVQYLPSAGEISFTSNGGDIIFENIDASESIGLRVKNGDIMGSIAGSWDEYSIRCSIKKGDCNLPSEKDGGEKYLYVETNNGDADIDFIAR